MVLCGAGPRILLARMSCAVLCREFAVQEVVVLRHARNEESGALRVPDAYLPKTYALQCGDGGAS